MIKPISALVAVAAFACATSAHAMDLEFSFDDDPSAPFYGRSHVSGTVKGILSNIDVKDPIPQTLTIISAPSGLVINPVLKSFGSHSYAGFAGKSLEDFSYNDTFVGDNGHKFQLRLNSDASGLGISGKANWLFWNDGPGPINGVGNVSGYSGVRYRLIPSSLPAVPEPSIWAMMVLGFGAMGYVMRRRLFTEPQIA